MAQLAEVRAAGGGVAGDAALPLALEVEQGVL